MAIDPKYVERARAIAQEAMTTAFVTGGPWYEDPRLRTAEQLEAEDQAKSAPRVVPAVPMTREQILTAKVAEAERETERLRRKLEKKMRKASR